MDVNFAMWGEAVRRMPRVTRQEWLDLDAVSRWLIATRAAALVMTLLSAALVAILAARAGQLDWGRWALVSVGLLFAHATNNLLNDLIDSKKGVDKDDYFRNRYGTQLLEQGLMSRRQMLGWAAATGFVALAIGGYLVYAGGPAVLGLLGAGAVFVVFYTWPLKYVGLGEIAVLIVWGPLMVGGGYRVVAGAFSWDVVVASLPYALGVTAVLFGKHIDKIDADRSKGIRTLPVVLGERAARAAVLAMMVLQYGLVVGLVVRGAIGWPALAVFVALPALRLAFLAYRAPRPSSPPPEYPAELWPLWYVSFSFLHNRRFGVLYFLGLVADLVVRRAIS